MERRTLSNGKSFSVVTIPKGTVLFHGFQGNYNGRANETKIMTELFGDLDESGLYCASNHTQKFFYPAPFMGDVVYKFQIYGVYILNYDVNVISFVLPDKSLHSEHGSLDSATIRCNHVSEQGNDKDECGMEYKSQDHCLTEILLKEHPDIHGYIAIHNTDGALYKSAFYSQLKNAYPNYTSMTTPMVVSDSKGLVAIPEIVLHPYHVRVGYPRRIGERIMEDPIWYTLKHISLLNYVPIMYFNESRTFSFIDLIDKKKRNELLSIERDLSDKAITPLIQRLKAFIDQALTPAGVKIHDMILKFSVDLRTGFYVAKHIVLPSPDMEVINIKVFKDPAEGVKDGDYDVVPFSYPMHMKKILHGLLSSGQKHPVDERRLSNELARIKASYNRKYVFDKGKAYRSFDFEHTFSFDKFKNKTRKQTYPRNYRRSKTMKCPR
jgi:hypothetical protein